MGFRLCGYMGRPVGRRRAEPLDPDKCRERFEEKAIKAGYLSGTMYAIHISDRGRRLGKTCCYVCGWFTHGSEKCSCSLLEDKLNKCAAERKEQNRVEHFWSIGGKPGEI